MFTYLTCHKYALKITNAIDDGHHLAYFGLFANESASAKKHLLGNNPRLYN